MRRLCYELRPDVLDNLGLIPALEWLTSELRNDRKIRGRIEVIGNERRLSGETELALFRIAQEALNNVKRHSQATEAVVKVQFTRKKFRMSVADNGKGFDLPESPDDFAQRGKLGLIGIKERVRLLNGTLSVVSHKGKGTTLSVEVAA